MTENLCEQVTTLIGTTRFNFANETELQRGVERLLRNERIEFRREYRLNAQDRPDFMVGNVVIECKVDGSNAGVQRQLERYAAHAAVEELLLVTNRSRHTALRGGINGKPVHVCFLLGACL